jgi:hypothetical protein
MKLITISLLLSVSTIQAWTTLQGSQSFARKSTLYMNVETVETKPNIKVGVIGMCVSLSKI